MRTVVTPRHLIGCDEGAFLNQLICEIERILKNHRDLEGIARLRESQAFNRVKLITVR
jgi:hypothetical protein